MMIDLLVDRTTVLLLTSRLFFQRKVLSLEGKELKE